ncbi:MAG: pseudouridine synthase [bacterium]
MKKKNAEMVRLNKFLSTHGIGSRRYCEELIRGGEVLVNGTVGYLGMKIDPHRDQIFLKNKGKIKPRILELHYIMLNKPCGYLTTMADPFARPTILELIPKISERIYPIGRLDFQSEGLLLLTNDGDLAYKLSHPSAMVPKTYLVKVKGKVSLQLQERLKKGIKLDDGWSSFDSIDQLKFRASANSWFKLTIHEGKNRMIRRVFSAIGHPVIKLKRISIAGLSIGDLKPGEWRYLTSREIRLLKEYNG